MSLIGDLLAPYALIASPYRAISFIIPDAVIEEVHADDLAITDHPVETGATISDHAFLLPRRLQMRCLWSDSFGGASGYSQAAYERLLGLQAQREPFSVFTGKRAYRNMLIGRIVVETNAASEYALPTIIELREVIITSTQQTSAGKGAGNGSQADPARTGSVTDGGNNEMVQIPGIVSPGLTTQISPNAVLFGAGPGAGGGGTSFAPGGSTFGFSGPTGPSPY